MTAVAGYGGNMVALRILLLPHAGHRCCSCRETHTGTGGVALVATRKRNREGSNVRNATFKLCNRRGGEMSRFLISAWSVKLYLYTRYVKQSWQTYDYVMMRIILFPFGRFSSLLCVFFLSSPTLSSSVKRPSGLPPLNSPYLFF